MFPLAQVSFEKPNGWPVIHGIVSSVALRWRFARRRKNDPNEPKKPKTSKYVAPNIANIDGKIGRIILQKKTFYPVPHGRGLLGLARALVATNGDKDRAIKLAKQAREMFGKAPYLKKNLEEVKVWLQERGVE